MLDTYDLTFSILTTWIGLMGAALNIVVCVAISRNRDLQTPNSVLAANLALACVTGGFLIPPLFIINLMEFELKYLDCFVLNIMRIFLENLSPTMVMVIACERFVAIRFPFYHYQNVDLAYAVYISVFGWTISIGGVATSSFFYWNTFNYNGLCVRTSVVSVDFEFYYNVVWQYSFSFVIMICMYCYIYKVARIQENAQRTLLRRFKNYNKEFRKTNLVIIIVLGSLVTQTPVAVMHCIAFLHIELPWDDSVTRHLYLCTFLIKQTEQLLNPFIYAASNSRINSAMRKVAMVDSSRLSISSCRAPPNTAANSRSNSRTRLDLDTVINVISKDYDCLSYSSHDSGSDDSYTNTRTPMLGLSTPGGPGVDGDPSHGRTDDGQTGWVTLRNMVTNTDSHHNLVKADQRGSDEKTHKEIYRKWSY